jgi:acetate kinase
VKILTLNTGSSSVKLGLFAVGTDRAGGEKLLLDGLADWTAAAPHLTVRRPGQPPVTTPLPQGGHGATIEALPAQLTDDEKRDIAAIGHRVVHGGTRFVSSVRVTPEVKAGIASLAELAPLHNPVNLEGIEAAEAAWPGVPQVAVFDTAFHATLPEAARTYGIPYTWTHDWGLRRYGFHGLSHAYCSSRAAELLGRGPHGLRLVICHLGQGCSLAAVRDGICVDTTMGFTPLDGLVMGTRSGSVDPGLLTFVLRHKGLSAEELDRILNGQSGLLGVSGLSGDMRQIQEAAHAGNARARLAFDVFIHRLRRMIGALALPLGGLDALVFTAGIGEHSSEVLAAACRDLAGLGVELDAGKNATLRPDADVAAATSRTRILIVATREDLTLVRETLRVLRAEANEPQA